MRAALAVALVALALACSSGAGPVPEPDLSRDLVAQRNMQRIRRTWDESDREGRAALEVALSNHLSRHASDPSTRPARAMLAFIALENGDLDRARSLAGAVLEGPAGASHDVASVTLGAVERRTGDARAAVKRLEPLFNKVIDPVARTTLNRELVLAATDARRFERAADFLQAYQRQAAPSERLVVEAEIQILAAKIPPKPLLELLRREQASPDPNPALLAVLTKQLGDVALRDEDVALAEDLLEIAGTLLGDRADALARIAARGASVKLERNTVGLVLPLRTEELRRRGVEVAAGLAVALDLPGGRARLVTRDDQRDLATIDESLALLNADGAAAIVAGHDVAEADAAAAYAERTGVPVVLLRPPTRALRKDGPVFVLGENPAEARAAVVRAMVARGFDKVAVLVGDRDEAGATVDEPGVVGLQGCGASLDFVRTAGASALVVDGGPACARDAIEARPAGAVLGFGLDAAASAEKGFFARAGEFPIRGASDDPMLAAWRDAGRPGPTWWNALGHDAGLLVKGAVLALPATSDGDEDAAASAKRKEAVALAIGRAEGRLWTTDARGFSGGRRLARSITVEERGPLPRAPARTKPKR